jgi:Icc protein
LNQFHWQSEILTIQTKSQQPKILQITDPHIFKNDTGCLLGLNTRDSLRAVLDDISANHLDADLVLATGDISQDHSLESYEHFASALQGLGMPVAWLPGNHDTPEFMADSLRGGHFVDNKLIEIGDWLCVLLDSSSPNAVHGALGEQQLDFLDQALSNTSKPYAMPVLHHHPVDIGCDWLAPIGLHDGQALLSMLYRFPTVKALLWGHIHQEYDTVLNDIRMLATPSTSVQFKPHSKDFSAGTESPGYRTLMLNNDGTLDTQVHRIEHIEFTVDYTVKGY